MAYTHRVVDDRDLSIKLEGSFDDCVAFQRNVSTYSNNSYAYWIFTIDKHKKMLLEKQKRGKGGAHGLCDE